MNTTTPSLFIKKGRNLQQVTPSQCYDLMIIYRGDKGASEMRKPWIDLFDSEGTKIGRVSYNGRVWVGETAIS